MNDAAPAVQIIGVIGFYVITALLLFIILSIVKYYERQQRIKSCMMNHPAGKQSKTEPLRTGPTQSVSDLMQLYPYSANPRDLLDDGGR